MRGPIEGTVLDRRSLVQRYSFDWILVMSTLSKHDRQEIESERSLGNISVTLRSFCVYLWSISIGVSSSRGCWCGGLMIVDTSALPCLTIPRHVLEPLFAFVFFIPEHGRLMVKASKQSTPRGDEIGSKGYGGKALLEIGMTPTAR